jgi:prolipoprotein diacylglyceryltransferase
MFFSSPPSPFVALHNILLALAALAGHFLLIWRAAQSGLHPRRAAGFSASLLLGAVCGGHALFLLQHPERFSWNPLQGGATLGCLLGAALAGALYLRRYKLPLQYFSPAAWSFPFAWILARSGCALAGEPLTHFEVAWAALLAAAFWRARRRPWPFPAILLVSYGLLRLAFFSLRFQPPAADLLGASLAISIGLLWSQRKFAC